MWIDPTDGKRILMGYDQGAIVSFDGGDTWSSWYNQSTEQVYHVATDNSFPYWIYTTQQDARRNRDAQSCNLGAITSIDWNPVPAGNGARSFPIRVIHVIYSSGLGHLEDHLSQRRMDLTWTGSRIRRSSCARSSDLPSSLHLHGRQELLAGYKYVMETADGGATWSKLSPDLTFRIPESPRSPEYTSPPAIRHAPEGHLVRRSIDRHRRCHLDRCHQRRHPGVAHHGRSWSDVTIPGTEIGARA